MTVVDQSVKLGMSSRKRKLPKEYEISPRPTKRSKSEYPTNKEMKGHHTDYQLLPATAASWIAAHQAGKAVRSAGKWKIFLSNLVVDEVWEKVKLLLLDNKLGNGANVSRMGNRSYVIHILTYDYEDVRDVFRVLVAIRRHRITASYLGYETATDPDSNQTDQGQQQASSGSAGNKRLRRNMYFSPSPAGNKDMVQLFSHKIGPGSEKKLVAEMKKHSDGTECETWYTPPKVVDAAAMEGPRVGRLDNNTKR